MLLVDKGRGSKLLSRSHRWLIVKSPDTWESGLGKNEGETIVLCARVVASRGATGDRPSGREGRQLGDMPPATIDFAKSAFTEGNHFFHLS